MNTVDVSMEGVEPPGWLDKFIRFCEKALRQLGFEQWEVSIILCNDRFIRNLNSRYRGKDEPTDVLSFPQFDAATGKRATQDAISSADTPNRRVPNGDGTYYAGDIVISLDTLSKNASHFHVGEEEELKRLTVHGLLHLAGHDHGTNGPEQPMLTLQEATLLRLTEERIF